MRCEYSSIKFVELERVYKFFQMNIQEIKVEKLTQLIPVVFRIIKPIETKKKKEKTIKDRQKQQ